MHDVARRAGVAGSTVSHVLNGTRFVSEATRQRVQDAVDALGYRQNSVARALAAQRTQTLGLAISVVTNPYFGDLVHAIERAITDAGYMLLLGDTHDDVAMERRVTDSLLDRRVDGMIVAPSVGSAASVLPGILAAETPLVLIDRNADAPCDQVTSAGREPARQLTEHLIEHGHTRIAVVTGITGLASTDVRRQGYLDALEAHGIPVDPALVLVGESQQHTAAEVVGRLFDESPRERWPTAVVVLNNAMTIGTVKGLHERGIRIPHDVAMAVFDDFEWADHFEPRLTAVAQDVEAMGRTAVEFLLQRLAGDDSPPRTVEIPASFNIRSSCGCNAADPNPHTEADDAAGDA